MSTICIKYSDLEASVKRSKEARGKLENYASELRSRIRTPISKLPGSDPQGYASTASSLALGKMNSIDSKISRFQTYENTLSTFISNAKTCDKNAYKKIESIANLYIEKRAWYQNVGDAIYNFFCVDLANSCDLTRALMDGAKWVGDKIGNGLEKVRDWFKYGDGKYVLKIATSVIAAVAAVGGAIAAIVGIPFSGGATIPIVIGCIGAVATSVGAIITVANTVSTVKGNSKALSLSGNIFDDDDGDPGAARYYGNINKLSDEWKKTDMGDAKTNAGYEKAGKVVDTTKVVVDTTAFVCNIASLGNVKDFRYKGDHVKGYSFTYDNIKRNIMHDMGFKVSSGKLDSNKAFGVTKNLFAKNYNADKFTLKWDGGSWAVPEKVVSLFKGVKITDNAFKTIKAGDTIQDVLGKRNPTNEDWSSFTESATGLLGNMKFFKPLDDYGTKGGKRLVDLLKLAQ